MRGATVVTDKQVQIAINRLALHVGLVQVGISQGAIAALLKLQLPILQTVIEDFLSLDLEDTQLVCVPQPLPPNIADAITGGLDVPDTLEGLC